MPANISASEPHGDYPLPSCIDAPLWSRTVSALGLPSQQARVLACVLRGLSDKQITGELKLRRPTVRTHLKRIFERTGMRGRTKLVTHVLQTAQSLSGNPVILEDDIA